MAMARGNGVATAFLLGLAFASCVAEGARRGLVDTDATVFDVTQHGAKADNTIDNALAFMRAWNAACQNNGAAKLLIPKGTYLAGPITFLGPCKSKDQIIIEVQGTVKAQTDMSLYSSKQWIWIQRVDGLIIQGDGTFDGQGGVAAWSSNDCGVNKDCQLPPFSIKFSNVNNAIVQEINSINSMSFHFVIDNCQNFMMRKLNISAPGDSPNTDGVHVSSSTEINITSSSIGTGDDCVSIGQGCTKVLVSDIFCGPGHGISIGSLGKYPREEPVNEIVVKNCTLSNTTNGARIKSWPGKLANQASNITFEDIIMDQVKNPIIIDQSYGDGPNLESSVKISDVHFRKIRGTSTSNIAVSLICSSLFPCEGIELVDIDLSYVGDSTSTTLSSSCCNAKFNTSGTMNPPVFKCSCMDKTIISYEGQF